MPDILKRNPSRTIFSMSTPAFFEDYLEFLRFASISTDSAYKPHLKACAEWLAAFLEKAGLKSEIHETPGHPIVIARSPVHPAKPTILIYGHYDVQPADPLGLWNHPPFEPHLENGKVYARGATDNKGQIFSHICGVRQLFEAGGQLPVNVLFLIEGEEEVGSDHLAPFLEAHKNDLKCAAVVISDTGMVAPGVPTFTYGLRGIAAMEVFLQGPDKDLHSGLFGGAVANPLTELCRLVATLHTADGKVAVEGFYDGIQPLENWEREAWKTCGMDDAELKRITGAPGLKGEAGYTSLERTWARPTCELNGLTGGYQGQGTKTVLPSKASAKLTFRLVPGQTPGHVLRVVEAHLRRHCPPSVTLRVEAGHSGEAYYVDPNGPQGLAAREALKEVFPGKNPVMIREGGSIPIVADFKKILGVDTLLLGLALPDAAIHSPNESFPVEHLDLGMRLNQALLRHLSR
jgi:acetylornithine deacetylase/succinyl-diaminopimelate desuccinylase-like protein